MARRTDKAKTPVEYLRPISELEEARCQDANSSDNGAVIRVLGRVSSAVDRQFTRAADDPKVASPTEVRHWFHAVYLSFMEVGHGGFAHYFSCSAGLLANDALVGLRCMKAEPQADLLEQAMAACGAKGPPRSSREQWKLAYETPALQKRRRDKAWSTLEKQWFRSEARLERALFDFLQAHAGEFFDRGRSIPPDATAVARSSKSKRAAAIATGNTPQRFLLEPEYRECLAKVDLFSFYSGRIACRVIDRVVKSIARQLGRRAGSLAAVSALEPARRGVWVCGQLADHVLIGGLEEYFGSPAGDHHKLLQEAFVLSGNHREARAIQRAVGRFPRGMPAATHRERSRQIGTMEVAGDEASPFERLLSSDRLCDPNAMLEVQFHLICNHHDQFFRNSPIDGGRSSQLYRELTRGKGYF